MKNLSNLLSALSIYLQSLGIAPEHIASVCSESALSGAVALRLPDSCVILANKTASGHQTHIHVTGPCMELFYPPQIISRATAQLDDTPISVLLFQENLQALYQENLNLGRNVPGVGVFPSHQGFIHSSTCKKLAIRGNQSKQVQLSKSRLDGEAFLQLREQLFTGDLLLFLRPVPPASYYYVVGIPASQSELFASLTRQVYFPSDHFTPLQEFVPQEEAKGNAAASLRKTTSSEIAALQSDAPEQEDGAWFDLSVSIAQRKQRTQEHQKAARILGYRLEQGGFALFEYPIDCLAVKDQCPLLIFEVKTLDGSEPDQRSQVLKAFSQLFYYESFALGPFQGYSAQKLALFTRPLSPEYTSFLESHHILVLWLNELQQLDGTPAALNFLRQWGL